MKRMHIHVAVGDLEKSVGFYSTLFGIAPTVRKSDYAKWRLEDPRVNFAISNRGRAAGLDHLGIETESAEELAGIAARLAAAGERLVEEQATTCCYARSDKAWVEDPEGLAWETFFSFGDSPVYGEEQPALAACCAGEVEAAAAEISASAASCCVPANSAKVAPAHAGGPAGGCCAPTR
jgi:catechol 2,3-dioxygenase-like lactoylglutathione lyase family enzyme